MELEAAHGIAIVCQQVTGFLASLGSQTCYLVETDDEMLDYK